MNVINGLEEDPTAFMTVCSMSAALGATIVLSYSWYLSADRMKKLTASHYSEIENIKTSLRYVNGVSEQNKKICRNINIFIFSTCTA